MRPRRKRTKIDYNESKLANQFTIDEESHSRKRKKRTTAEKELNGKTPYRGSAPAKPAPHATVLDKKMPVPKRRKDRRLIFKDHPEFSPNLSPKEVLQLGSFGGTYFRPITSGVTGTSYKNVHQEFPADWFEGLDIKTQITSKTYDESVNKYEVKCGGSLDMWEGSGWISDIDPYGWFQWYCRFYLGRRSTDDDRQIARGNKLCGPKGRFRNQLIGKCARRGCRFDDVTISPVIRQTLQHWGYVLTQKDADAYVKKKKLPKLPP